MRLIHIGLTAVVVVLPAAVAACQGAASSNVAAAGAETIGDQPVKPLPEETSGPSGEIPAEAVNASPTALDESTYALRAALSVDFDAPDVELLGDLASSAPSTWGQAWAWAAAADPSTGIPQAKLACQQRELVRLKWYGSCGVGVGLAFERTSADAAQIVGSSIRGWGIKTQRGGVATEPTLAEQKACERYGRCLARHVWLGRTAPWHASLPQSAYVRLRETQIARGGSNAATPGHAERNGSQAMAVLNAQGYSSVEDYRQRSGASLEDLQLAVWASHVTFSEWLIATKPWNDWDSFVSKTLVQ